MTLPDSLSRRAMLMKIGLFFNGLVALRWQCLFCVTFYRLCFAGEKPVHESGSLLELADQFPAGQTRLATFRNPDTTPWDGQTADSRLLGASRR